MKNIYILLFYIASFSFLIGTSCTSHEQKANDGFDFVNEGKLISKDSSIISKATVQLQKKTEPARKNDTQDEWENFNKEIESKINANKARIKVIRGVPGANAKMLKKVAAFEMDNNDLRKQMDEFKETMKGKLDLFKVKMNHDANEIGIDLKDITLTNKK